MPDPAPESGADASPASAPDTSDTSEISDTSDAAVPDLTAAFARAAGRRAVLRRAADLPVVVPRPRAPVPTGPAAQRALRRRLGERLGNGSDAAGGDARFSVAVVDVFPAPDDARATPGGSERLLAALGSRLADVTRPSDLVVRPSAGRFVLVLNGVRDNYGLAAARRRITDVLLRPVLVDGRPIRTTVAVGVLAAEPGETVDGILSRVGAVATRDRRAVRRLRSVPRPDAGA